LLRGIKKGIKQSDVKQGLCVYLLAVGGVGTCESNSHAFSQVSYPHVFGVHVEFLFKQNDLL
jgi:hypothetical protein